MTVPVDGTERAMCCIGCQAVAKAIVDGGHGDYYRHRDALPESPREALPSALGELGVFDHPEVQKGFVRPIGDHESEASLILEGITCAACVWLNESHLSSLAGVTAVDINYTTRRARVRWDSRAIKLSQILESIAAIGYRAHPYDTEKFEQLAQKERKSALWRLFVAGFGMMQVMMYAIPVYLADDGTMTEDIEHLMRWASLLLTLPVVLYSSAPFFRNAFRDLRFFRVGMDVPVALGIGAAFLASLIATVVGHGEVYFDSVTMFVFFLLTGRYLEMMARQQAVRGVESMARALPVFAFRLKAYPALDGEKIVIGDLVEGDFVLVKPGEVVPADGTVVWGDSAVDESLLTGESLPVVKAVGAAATGGTVNTVSPLVIQVERVGGDTRLASIARLMESAAVEKPRMVMLADRVAARFVLALLVLAVVTAGGWWFIDPDRMLMVFISVLVVSCPCALSLATPAALTVASGVLASRGLLVAKGHAIESLAKINRMIFDKTGTLTLGKPILTDVYPVNGWNRERVLSLAAAMEVASEHPLAMALISAAQKEAVAPLTHVAAIRSLTGQGVVAEIDGESVRLGRLDFVAQAHGCPIPADIQVRLEQGNIVIGMGSGQGWYGFFVLEDELRPSATTVAARLRQLNVSMLILSGDMQAATERVGMSLGGVSACGGLSPEGKRNEVKTLQDAGEVVSMVGDGVNDGPVLAQAQVSIAMGEGTDLARTQGDMVLLGGDLSALADGVRIARQTMKIVHQNLMWAFAYNFLAIPVAMLGWVTPWMAGIGMSASSLLVVLNALRLQKDVGLKLKGQ